MSIHFQCPSCGEPYRVADAAAGTRGKCRRCGDVIRVPEAGRDAVSTAAPSVAPTAAAAAPTPRRHPVPAEPVPAAAPPPPRVAAGPPPVIVRPPALEPPLSYGYAPAPPPFGGYAGYAAISPPARRGSSWKVIVPVVAACLLVVVLLGVVIRKAVVSVRSAAQTAVARATAAQGGVKTVAAAGVARPNAFRQLEPGVQFAEVSAGGPTAGLRLWVYLPEHPAGRHPPASLPCVFVAPAGSNLMTGMSLGDGDRPEHLPYVRAGFAVVAYEIDGRVPGDDLDAASDVQVGQAMLQFMAADAGVANGRAAVDYARARLPEVDPARLYAAGHSSAGTLSLLMAVREPRLAGAVAFAPCLDIEKFHGKDVIAEIGGELPGFVPFVRQTSPARLPPPARPVFLFQAEDDEKVRAGDLRAYAARTPQAVVQIVPAGGHYDPMISAGIPRAIDWLKANGARPQAVGARAAGDPTPARGTATPPSFGRGSRGR